MRPPFVQRRIVDNSGFRTELQSSLIHSALEVVNLIFTRSRSGVPRTAKSGSAATGVPLTYSQRGSDLRYAKRSHQVWVVSDHRKFTSKKRI